MQQLEEEALMQQCIEAMQDEMDSLNPANSGGYQNGNGASNGTAEDILTHGLQELSVHDDPSQPSKLNPDAAEFVPRISSVTAAPAKED